MGLRVSSASSPSLVPEAGRDGPAEPWLFIHTCTKTPDRPDLDIGAGESRGDPLAAGGHVPVRKNPAPLRSCRGAEPPDDDRILGVGDGAESDWHSVGTGPESATVKPGRAAVAAS